MVYTIIHRPLIETRYRFMMNYIPLVVRNGRPQMPPKSTGRERGAMVPGFSRDQAWDRIPIKSQHILVSDFHSRHIDEFIELSFPIIVLNVLIP